MFLSSHAVLLLSCIASAQTRQIIDGRDNTWLVTACVVGTITSLYSLLFASYFIRDFLEGGVLASGAIFCLCSMIRTRLRTRHHGQYSRTESLTSAATPPVWPEVPQGKVTDAAEAEQAPYPPPPATITEPQLGQLSYVHELEETKHTVCPPLSSLFPYFHEVPGYIQTFDRNVKRRFCVGQHTAPSPVN